MQLEESLGDSNDDLRCEVHEAMIGQGESRYSVLKVTSGHPAVAHKAPLNQSPSSALDAC